MKRSRLAALAAVGMLVAVTAPAALARPGDGSKAEQNAQTTEVQVLALNDFHGNLESRPAARAAGSVRSRAPPRARRASRPGAFRPAGPSTSRRTSARWRHTNPNTLFVSAGDLIGATPLVSAVFHDEPTIEAFNLMGLDFNGVGNHEFDEGVDELLRMQNGGCHPADGCQDGTMPVRRRRLPVPRRQRRLQGQW